MVRTNKEIREIIYKNMALKVLEVYNLRNEKENVSEDVFNKSVLFVFKENHDRHPNWEFKTFLKKMSKICKEIQPSTIKNPPTKL